MLPPALANFIFSLRTFAAAMLALYLSYHLDLSRPTWAFITTYIVSAPLRGAGRSKGIYRICGTICGAAFTVAAVPNLVDAPELLTLAIACWISGCLYLSILDGTPRSYALLLAGYTAALIGFPSVDVPQTIFDIAISRTEEIGLAILCVELMSYLPFHQRAGNALQLRINHSFVEMSTLVVNLLTYHPDALSVEDRARPMIDVARLDDLRIQAHYDTPGFEDVEAWVVSLQRYLRDFFTDAVTLEAQLRELRNQNNHHLLQPFITVILAWIDSKEIAVPQTLLQLLVDARHDPAQEPLAKSGLLDTLSDIILRRSECLELKRKIVDHVKTTKSYVTIARFVDYRQAAFYGLTVSAIVIGGSLFWTATEWPEGGVMVMLMAVVCCFFSSLEAPPSLVFVFMGALIIGSVLGWFYNFLIFPYIDGFPLLVYVLAFSCIPIGICLSNPKLAGAMVPLMLGINLADMHNRYSLDAAAFQNGFIAQTLGICVAGFILAFVHALTLESATRRLLGENARTLAYLAANDKQIPEDAMDRMTHRSALALVRAKNFSQNRDKMISRVLLDLQTADALIKLHTLKPRLPEDVQDSLHEVAQKLAAYFAERKERKPAPPVDFSQIAGLGEGLKRHMHNAACLRLSGLMRTLARGMEREAA